MLEKNDWFDFGPKNAVFSRISCVIRKDPTCRFNEAAFFFVLNWSLVDYGRKWQVLDDIGNLVDISCSFNTEKIWEADTFHTFPDLLLKKEIYTPPTHPGPPLTHPGLQRGYVTVPNTNIHDKQLYKIRSKNCKGWGPYSSDARISRIVSEVMKQPKSVGAHLGASEEGDKGIYLLRKSWFHFRVIWLICWKNTHTHPSPEVVYDVTIFGRLLYTGFFEGPRWMVWKKIIQLQKVGLIMSISKTAILECCSQAKMSFHQASFQQAPFCCMLMLFFLNWCEATNCWDHLQQKSNFKESPEGWGQPNSHRNYEANPTKPSPKSSSYIPDQSAPKDVEAVVISPPAQVCGQWTFDSSWQYPISTVRWVRYFRTHFFLIGMAMAIYQWNFNITLMHQHDHDEIWWSHLGLTLSSTNCVKIQHPNASNFQNFSRRILQLWIGWQIFIVVQCFICQRFFSIYSQGNR